MKRKTLSVILAGAAVVALGGTVVYGLDKAPAPSPVVSARLCKIYNIENAARRDASGQCVAPNYENDAKICVSPSQVNNAFSYIIKEDGSLDFGLSYWFASGSNCGMVGNAKQTATGWRYEHEEANNPDALCAVDIKIQGDYVTFDADPQKPCRAQCGVHAELRGTVLPFSALESKNVTPKDLEPETFFNTPCKAP